MFWVPLFSLNKYNNIPATHCIDFLPITFLELSYNSRSINRSYIFFIQFSLKISLEILKNRLTEDCVYVIMGKFQIHFNQHSCLM